MKKFITTIALLTSAVTFAEMNTGSVTVFGSSEAEVEAKFETALQRVRRGNAAGMNCSSNIKVYGASGISMSYRVNRFGELQKQYTQTIKYSCND